MTVSGHDLPGAACPDGDTRAAHVSFWIGGERAGNVQTVGEKEIQAKVVGNDIIDSFQWSMYLRPDGALIRDERDRKVTGVWKIQKNKLCLSEPSNQLLNCHEVWMSGQKIRLRVNKDEETFDAVVAKHKAD